MSSETFPPLQNDLILRAARGQKVERTPVWIMRQAGRYLPEFRQVRAESKKDFFEVCRTPSLVAELTIQPIKRFDLDAAIIFSDILVVPQCMGLEVQMQEKKGPFFPNPLKSPEEIETRLIKDVDVNSSLGYVFEAITLTRKELKGKVPLIGFSGAPWTLMAYMIEGEGSKTWAKAKSWLFRFPSESHKLLTRVTDVIIQYLKGQIKAGAQLLQVFDSWAGELGAKEFNEFGLPYLLRIAKEINAEFPDVPLIVFAKDANQAISSLSSSCYSVIGLSWTIEAQDARKAAGEKLTLQGNLDPCVLFADQQTIQKHVFEMLSNFGSQKYIANLGHGLLPEHNPENVKIFIDSVHQISEQLIKENK